MKSVPFGFVFCAMVGLTGCSMAAGDGNDSNRQAFAGVWIADPGTNAAERIEFGPDASCRIASKPCTFTLDARSEQPSVESPWTVSFVLSDGVRRTLQVIATESEPSPALGQSSEGFAFAGRNLLRVMGYELSGHEQAFFAYSKQGLDEHGVANDDSKPKRSE